MAFAQLPCIQQILIDPLLYARQGAGFLGDISDQRLIQEVFAKPLLCAGAVLGSWDLCEHLQGDALPSSIHSFSRMSTDIDWAPTMCQVLS